MSRASVASRRLVKRIEPRQFSGIAYRFIGSRFLDSPLTSAGSRLHGGRFNPPGSFEVLYTALGADTAVAEREGILLTGPGIRAARGVRTGILLRIDCRLEGVLDLTDAATGERLGITLASLLGPWLPWNARSADLESLRRPPPLAPSQKVGVVVYESRRFEAILCSSAKDPRGRCLAVFPDRLQPGSSLSIDDPRGILRGVLGFPSKSQKAGGLVR